MRGTGPPEAALTRQGRVKRPVLTLPVLGREPGCPPWQMRPPSSTTPGWSITARAWPLKGLLWCRILAWEAPGTGVIPSLSAWLSHF